MHENTDTVLKKSDDHGCCKDVGVGFALFLVSYARIFYFLFLFGMIFFSYIFKKSNQTCVFVK